MCNNGQSICVHFYYFLDESMMMIVCAVQRGRSSTCHCTAGPSVNESALIFWSFLHFESATMNMAIFI